MRKVLPYLGASLSALAMAWSIPTLAQNPFKDVDPNHWAYAAVTDLQNKQILEGYPDGYFRGKRTLTRYEFAVALKRALDKVGAGTKGDKGDTGPAGEAGPAGPAGPAGEQGPPGMTPEEVAQLKALTNEFRNELTSLGANVRDINNRLDALSKDVADLKRTINAMPKISGDFFLGVRNDRSRFGFVDQSGAFRPASSSHLSRQDVVHDFQLGIKANLPGDVKFTGALFASNYLDYRGGTLSQGGIANTAISTAGTPSLAENFGVYQAQLDIPIGGFGSNTVLTVGRFKHQLTPLTYWRPDLDSYFDVPQYDDGMFVQDGFRLSSKFGSATTAIWGGSFATPTLNQTSSVGFLAFNRPLVGGVGFGRRTLGGFRPTGIDALNQTIAANQNAGIKIGIPLFTFGELGISTTLFSSNGSAVTPATPFNDVIVYAANLTLKNLGKFTLNLEGAKSVTQVGWDTGDGQENEDNNAFMVNGGYGSGPLKVEAGYQYIDPRYGAPGYWNQIGSWINPTNVQGPYVRVNYNLTKKLQLNLGGDFLWGARNRPGYLLIDDNITRANVGVKYNLNKTFDLHAGYEGVFYDLKGGAGAGLGTGAASKPLEQYLTFGAGINLATNTALRLGYQMINVSNLNGGFLAGGTGFGGGFGGNGSGNASVFTTQLAVRF